jgi:hypothetical protein
VLPIDKNAGPVLLRMRVAKGSPGQPVAASEHHLQLQWNLPGARINAEYGKPRSCVSRTTCTRTPRPGPR